MNDVNDRIIQAVIFVAGLLVGLLLAGQAHAAPLPVHRVDPIAGGALIKKPPPPAAVPVHRIDPVFGGARVEASNGRAVVTFGFSFGK